MAIAIITGSAGLVGSEATEYFAGRGLDVVGIDNDLRKYFFGVEASTYWNLDRLSTSVGPKYFHNDIDIRDRDRIDALFRRYASDIRLVVHCAAQPSHDWALSEPETDFTINANGTLNLLEATRKHAKDAVFIYTSTNKVYGDTPNRLPLTETDSRWEIDPKHLFANGISEDMSIDRSIHSLFGVSKAAADLLVQEYGRNFGMRTACFRGGCLTGPHHSGAPLHGFLAYLMKCAATSTPYTIHGYKGKQVRDNIHSADLICAMDEFFKAPRSGEVYNIGGSRFSNCSMLEAIRYCEEITERKMVVNYSESNRVGDHIWWISDVKKFQSHYPAWKLTADIQTILNDIYHFNRDRWSQRSK